MQTSGRRRAAIGRSETGVKPRPPIERVMPHVAARQDENANRASDGFVLPRRGRKLNWSFSKRRALAPMIISART